MSHGDIWPMKDNSWNYLASLQKRPFLHTHLEQKQQTYWQEIPKIEEFDDVPFQFVVMVSGVSFTRVKVPKSHHREWCHCGKAVSIVPKCKTTKVGLKLHTEYHGTQQSLKFETGKLIQENKEHAICRFRKLLWNRLEKWYHANLKSICQTKAKLWNVHPNSIDQNSNLVRQKL